MEILPVTSSPAAPSAGVASGADSGMISDQAICTDLLNILKRFKGAMADMAEANGLTSIQLYALHAIMQGSRTMGKVAHTLHCDASNVTGIVDRLVALNLLVRAESPQDRRVKTLELTVQGEQLIHGVMADMPRMLGCSELSGQERANLHHSLQRLAPGA